MFIFHFSNDFLFILKVKIHCPIINPVRPLFCQHFARDNARLVFLNLDNFAIFNDQLFTAIIKLRLNIRNESWL